MHPLHDMSSKSAYGSEIGADSKLPPQGLITPMYETPARYRGAKEDEATDWDAAASNHVDTMLRPSGDICDCLSPCRRPCGLRRPPNFRQLARYGETSKRTLPFGVVWLVRDACGLICATFTWLLILYAEFVVTCVIIQQAPSPAFCWIAGFIFQVFALNAIYSHYKAVTTDPGTVQLGNATKDAAMQLQLASGSPYPIKVIRCPKCYCVKPDRTHHCRICNRCIRKMDHHCPWVNNCVGEGNQKYFVLFTMYICLMSVWSIYMSAHFIIMCIGSDWEGCRIKPFFSNDFGPRKTPKSAENSTSSKSNLTHALDLSRGWLDFNPSTTGFLCLGLVCEAVLFGLFTLIMCTSQFCAIYSDETTIESLQKGMKLRTQRSASEAIGTVMGGPMSWRWFCPFVSPPPLPPVIPNPDAIDPDPERLTEVRTDMPLNNNSELAPLRSNDELNDAQYRRFDAPGNLV